MNNFLRFALVFLAVFVFANKVFAYDLTLTSVGSQSTLGTNYSLVDHTGGIPTLVGTSSPSAEVSVKIKTILGSTTASTSGIWQFVPASLDQGDNVVVITSGLQSISFTLRFNSTASGAVATPAAIPDESALPGAGVWEYYIPAIFAGVGVYFMGRYVRRWMQNWDRDD